MKRQAGSIDADLDCRSTLTWSSSRPSAAETMSPVWVFPAFLGRDFHHLPSDNSFKTVYFSSTELVHNGLIHDGLYRPQNEKQEAT